MRGETACLGQLPHEELFKSDIADDLRALDGRLPPGVWQCVVKLSPLSHCHALNVIDEPCTGPQFSNTGLLSKNGLAAFPLLPWKLS